MEIGEAALSQMVETQQEVVIILLWYHSKDSF